MPSNIYGAIALTGGAAGALDAIDGSNLADKDMAIVSVLTGSTPVYYLYALDADSAAAESSPNVISPDASAGTKRWVLCAQIPVDEDNMSSDSALKVPTQQSVRAYVDSLLTGYTKRPFFTYNGGASAYTVKVGAGRFMVKDKIAQWASELTTTAIAGPAASTWYYLYLDYSAITSGTAITNAELIWSTTAPSFNHTYGGYYNGDDLCIFAVLTNSGPTNIEIFYHYGSRKVFYDEFIVDNTWAGLTTSWVAASAAMTVPTFVGEALVSFHLSSSASAGLLHVRPNGSGATNGFSIASFDDSDTAGLGGSPPVALPIGSNRKLDAKFSSGTAQAIQRTNGFVLPAGM